MSDSLRADAAGSGGHHTEASEPASVRRIEITVHGRVQGVGFRWFVSRAASRLELHGWVSNRPDGSVEVVAEGPPGALESLLGVVQSGPSGAQVERVDVRHSPATGSVRGFEIRSGSHPGD